MSFFSITRHKCRKCGRYVCDSCSSRRILRIGPMKDEPVRLCDPCYFVLHPDKAALHKLGFGKLAGGSKHKRMESLTENQEEDPIKKGFLKKFAGIKGWRSRWFVLRKSTLAYFESEAVWTTPPLSSPFPSFFFSSSHLSSFLLFSFSAGEQDSPAGY